MIIEQAKDLAIRGHGDQKRKYTNEPYWYHCREVAELVRSVGSSDFMIAAAWMHDLLEDTRISIKEIKNISWWAGEYVLWLTDSDKSVGNRATRKRLDRERLQSAPNEVKTIKLGDIISNVPSIIQYDPKFAKVYVNEKKLQLDVLTGGNKILYNKACKIVYGT